MNELGQIIINNPNISSSELATGCSGSVSMQPVSELDPSFHNQGYLSYVKNKMLKLFNKKTTGSVLGPETIDGSFHYFDLMNTSENKDYVLEAQLSPA
jgi:hypothetical protein